MSFATTKAELAKAILKTDDRKLISQVKAIMETRAVIDWNDFSDKMKARIEKSIKEADAGIGTPHEEVMKKYKKWLKRK